MCKFLFYHLSLLTQKKKLVGDKDLSPNRESEHMLFIVKKDIIGFIRT